MAVTSSKTCTNPECRQANPQPLEHFHLNPRNKKDGRRARCKPCVARVVAKWAAENRERKAESDRRYRSSHRERRNEAQRQYRAAHPEKVAETQKRCKDSRREKLNEYNRQWLKDNPEYHSQYRAIYPDKVAAAIRRWNTANPEKVRNNNARRRARMRGCDADLVDLKAILWRDESVCYLCGLTVKPQRVHKELHIEHKTPLKRGGTYAPENLAVSHQWCNNSKGTKTEAEYREWLLTHVSIVDRHRATGRDVGEIPTPERWEQLKRELEGEPVLVLVA